MVMSGSHDMLLVALSVLIAVAASYTALDLASRVREAGSWLHHGWLMAAALAMGGGIWSMHFVGMLAFSLPGLAVRYETGLTLLSLAIAILATGGALFVVSRRRSSIVAVGLSGIFLGAGIAAMHYVGMAGMQVPAMLHHAPAWVALSIVVAVTASIAALWLAFRVFGTVSRVAAAGLMGLAIAGMHYTGMRGAMFHGEGGQAAQTAAEAAHDGFDQHGLAVAVAVATFAILFLGLIAAMFDRRITSVVAREALALRRSEERFRSLYRQTPLPLHRLDEAGRIDQVSEAWLQLLGYRSEEVIGRPLTDLMTEASAQQRRQDDWPRLKLRGRLSAVAYRFMAKDGAIREVLAHSRAQRDEDGAFLGEVGGLVDVTAQRRAEEALRQSQKMEAVGQLTGGVAHDFNNLLAVVIGNLEMLRKRMPDDARTQRQLDNALQAAQRGAALTQRMLAFARRQELKPEPVNVAGLIHGMADLLERATGPTVRIAVHMPLHMPDVLVDGNQLELALLNLCVNARDAMPQGGRITISAECGPVPKLGGGGLAGDFVHICVADEGQGMSEATLARAREPFFTTKGLGEGTGLGLSMVHGLAEQSGGRLDLDSRPGQGTRATIWLPLAPPRSEPLPSRLEALIPDALSASAPEPLTILVVDDDPMVRLNTAEMLEDVGHRVVQAASGPEALALLGGTPGIEVVVTDFAMPDMTGVQLAGEIRARRPHMPIVLASGYLELEEVMVSDLPRLAKPFSQAMLTEAIDAERAAGRAREQIIPFPARAS